MYFVCVCVCVYILYIYVPEATGLQRTMSLLVFLFVHRVDFLVGFVRWALNPPDYKKKNIHFV